MALMRPRDTSRAPTLVSLRLANDPRWKRFTRSPRRGARRMRFVRVIVARTLRSDALQQRLLLRRNLVIPAEAAQLQALRDTQRRFHEADRGSRLIARLHRIQKQIQPA